MTPSLSFFPEERVAPPPIIAGADYDETRDRVRLTRQIDCIRAVIVGDAWWTIQKLVAVLRKRFPNVGFPENSVQAQLRNLRKEGYTVERRHIKNGLFEYRAMERREVGQNA